MNRRDFLRAASGAAGATAATGAASAEAGSGALSQVDNGSGNASGNQSGNGSGNQSGNQSTGGGGGGGGGTATVEVGPGGDFTFVPGTSEPLYIAPGTTVNFVWESDNHNIVVEEQPSDANWEGTPGSASKTYNTGYEYSHTFEVLGEYHYVCEPHKGVGMVADIVVNESGEAPGGGGGGEINPEEMGVPFQAHYVGIATVVMMLVSLVFTFFTVKYGESRHSSSPE
jgi:plastocyanin